MELQFEATGLRHDETSCIRVFQNRRRLVNHFVETTPCVNLTGGRSSVIVSRHPDTHELSTRLVPKRCPP